MIESSRNPLFSISMWVLVAWIALGNGPARAESACDAASVAGEYGFEIAGFANKQPRNGRSHLFVQKPLRGIGVLTLDADGTAHVLIKGFIAETPQIDQGNPDVVEFTGSWFVDEDCTGEIDLLEFGPVVDWIFVSVNAGTELFVLSNPSLSQLRAKRL